MVEHRDGTRVATRGKIGFFESPLRFGYVKRTYVDSSGPLYARVYRSYFYRGTKLYSYVPRYVYSRYFYLWAINPWPAPVSYNWGWGSNDPWFVYYQPYLVLEPTYSSADLWITDYILASNLREAYDSEPGAAPIADSGQPTDRITGAEKQSIAEAVHEVLQREQRGDPTPPKVGAEQLPEPLMPENNFFVVYKSLEVADGERTCTLIADDTLTRIDGLVDANNTVRVRIERSVRCPREATPRVGIPQLQEMLNEFRAKQETALEFLASNQGRRGIPAAPDATGVPFEDGQSTPDPRAVLEIQRAGQDADAAEAQARQVTNGRTDN
jgi:hypothetical protein